MRNKAERVFAQIYRKLDRILSIGVRPGMTIEEEREVSNANLLFILAFILGLNMIFEIMNFHLYRYYPIPIITIAIAAIGMACSIEFGRPFLPSLILVAGLSAFFLYLVATGGSTHTAFVWVFVFPFLHFLTFSFRVALALFLSVLAGLAAILFIPGNPFLFAEYSDVMRHRIFAVYLFIGFAAIASEFIQWRAQQKIEFLMTKIIELSRTDELTGLFNRRAFLERMEYETRRSVRGSFAMTLVMFDIDHFKRINDERGHACGDAALKQLAEFTHTRIRAQDTLARWGGEEFIVLLPETETTGGMVLAETLREGIEKMTVSCNGGEFSLTVSLGVHQYDFKRGMDENIDLTDKRLYQAKESGRNRVCGPPV